MRETGGLRDTVEACNERIHRNRISFTNYNAHEMLNTVRYAERIYYDRKHWNKIVERAMSKDFFMEEFCRMPTSGIIQELDRE